MRKFHVAALMLLLMVGAIVRAEPIALASAGDSVQLGAQVEVLEDPEGNWTLSQIRDQFAQPVSQKRQ